MSFGAGIGKSLHALHCGDEILFMSFYLSGDPLPPCRGPSPTHGRGVSESGCDGCSGKETPLSPAGGREVGERATFPFADGLPLSGKRYAVILPSVQLPLPPAGEGWGEGDFR